jgi:hypothetical protein
MPSNDNQNGETIFPGGVDVNVPDLTVSRADGVVVFNTAAGSARGLYASDGNGAYALIGGQDSVPWPGSPEYEGVIVASQPADAETYTLQVGANTTVYTFKTVLTVPAVAAEVLIGANAAATQDNLATVIVAVQGSGGLGLLYASNFANPLVLVANDTADAITQTDGTGGNLTLRTTANWGAPLVAAQQVSFFHVRKTITAAHVTDGGIYVPLPVGYTVLEKSGIILDGGGGKGQDSLEVKAGFDGVFTSNFPLAGEPEVVGVTQGVTTYAAGDVLVLWGFLAQT